MQSLCLAYMTSIGKKRWEEMRKNGAMMIQWGNLFLFFFVQQCNDNNYVINNYKAGGNKESNSLVKIGAIIKEYSFGQFSPSFSLSLVWSLVLDGTIAWVPLWMSETWQVCQVACSYCDYWLGYILWLWVVFIRQLSCEKNFFDEILAHTLIQGRAYT